MSTANETPAKLPLIKRIVLAVRGGVGEGVSAVLILVLLVLFCVALLGGFVGGVMVGMKRDHAVQQRLIADLRATHVALKKANEDNAALNKQVADQTDAAAAQQAELQQLKDQVTQAKLEHDAMEKVLTDIRDSLHDDKAPKDAKSTKVEKAVQGAMLKFGSRECALANGDVSSKQDVKCLNLREAIDAMNGTAPGNADSANKAAPAKPGK